MGAVPRRRQILEFVFGGTLVCRNWKSILGDVDLRPSPDIFARYLLTTGQNCPALVSLVRKSGMDKRDRFVAELRDKEKRMLKTYTYRAILEPGDEGGIVVTFPDVPEAITEGDGPAEARSMAADALGLVLLAYLRQGRPLPKPSRVQKGMAITVEPEVAAKIAVIEAFQQARISKAELGQRLRKDEKEVRRILDPMHATKLPALKEALAVLGRRLVVGVEMEAA